MQSCLSLLKDEKALKELHSIIDKCDQELLEPVTEKVVNKVQHIKRTTKEFRLNAQIGDFDMDNIVLDLGSNVNIFPSNTWEMMGKPNIIWSHVQLRLANQQKNIPFGRLKKVNIDIDGVCSVADSEVIEIVDDNNPYPALLVLDWEFYN